MRLTGRLLLIIFFSLIYFWGQAQSDKQIFNIRGKVVDIQNQPLVGAGIYVENTKKGTFTDVDGYFSIILKKGDIITVSYIGMFPKSIKIKNNKFLKIVLLSDDALNGVVVTGYKKENSKLFVGSASRISTKDFLESPQADFTKLLESKAPGLNISNVSNTFGAAPKINIRGGGSINSSVQPLWVVDGAIYDDMVPLNTEELVSGDPITLLGSSVAGLNPSDIQNIEVLKDATATSLYGAKGMNGVIVITTKSGKYNSGYKFHYDFVSSYRMKPNYGQYNRLDSKETSEIYKDMSNKGFFSFNDSYYGRRGGVYTQMWEMIRNNKLENTLDARNKFLDIASNYNTDWFNLLYTNNLTEKHSFSVSYGGKQNKTYVSASFYNDRGQTISEGIKRFTANIRNTYKVNNNFYFTLGAQSSYRSQKTPGIFDRHRQLEEGSYKRDFDINPFLYSLNTPRNLRPYNDDGRYSYYRNDWAKFNIIEEYSQNSMNINVLDSKFYLNTHWNVLKSLKLNALITSRWVKSGISHKIGSNSNVVRAMRANDNYIVNHDNIYLYHDLQNPNLPAVVSLPKGGIFIQNSRDLFNYLGRFSAEYQYQQGNHLLHAFAFAELKATDYKISDFKGYGIDFNRANNIATTPTIFKKIISEGQNYFSFYELHERNIAYSASMTYSYANKYILNLVGNYEGSNISGKGTLVRWLPTWNIGGKWNVDEEDFFKPVRDVVSQLSLRSSYGLSARLNPNAINSLPVYISGLTFNRNIDDRENSIRLKSVENRDLTWEKMYEFNIGLDLGLFDGRILTTVDLYHRKSFDLIDFIRTSGIGGEYQKTANFGDMRTCGIDLSVNTINIRTDNFEWKTTFNFSMYSQEITRLINNPSTFDLVSGNGRGNLKGYPRGALYSFDYKGLTNMGLPYFNFGNLPNNGLSQDLYKTSGANFYDTQYNKSYLVYNGPVEPNIFLGLYNSFRYKNFSLSFFISGKFGNKIRITPTYDPLYNDLNVFSNKFLNRWRIYGDEKLTSVPTIPGVDLVNLYGAKNIERAYNTYNYSSTNIIDGSFIRLNTITLTYQLPNNFCKYLRLGQSSISLQAQNPFLIYVNPELRGEDPEYMTVGGVSSPTPRSFSIALNLNF